MLMEGASGLVQTAFEEIRISQHEEIREETHLLS
jgi:hypothetical protein